MKTVLLILLFIPVCVNAQDPNKPYRLFVESYKQLDAKLIGLAYSEEAVLINVYNNQDPTSLKGKEAIESFFQSLFETAKEDDTTLLITFKVSSRKRIAQDILDNGFYHLKVSKPNNESYDRYGKFSIVLQQESGEWKFAMDANASASQEEFEKSISILTSNE